MKITTLITFILILAFSNSVSAQIQPVENQLRDRIPELPITHPGGIAVDPIRTPAPLPPLPPLITHTTPPPLIVDGQDDKKVFFVHGFGGLRDRWTRVMAASEFKQHNTQGFEARELNALAVNNYPENGNITSAVNDVGEFIHQHSENMIDSIRKKNFIIGHSQGGIIGRFLVAQDYCTNNPQALGDYGGLVTFGSALNGAQIMNSRNAGLINDLGTDFCAAILDAFGADNPILHLIIEQIDALGNPESFPLTVCDFLEQNLLPVVLGDLEAEIGNDYIVGSSSLETANDCLATDIHKVAFYGDEPYETVDSADFPNPIFYRTVQHFIKDVNSSEYWDANDDNELAIKASKAANDAYAKAQEKLENIQIWEQLLAFGFPFGLVEANQWSYNDLMALNRIYYDVNDRWMTIIGAHVVENIATGTTTYHHCSCNISQGPWISSETIPNVTSQSGCTHPDAVDCTYTSYPITSYTPTFVEKLSDGVVLAESGRHMTGAASLPQRLEVHYFQSDEEYIYTGSSHMQMRNDRHVRDGLRRLFDGDIDPWFETQVQN